MLIGDDDDSTERAGQAKSVLSDGQAYVSQLLESDDAKRLEDEETIDQGPRRNG